jgi:hypothetical protein
MTADELPKLTALELERIVSVDEGARLKGVSTDTFRRRYPHILRRISPRRIGAKLRDVLTAEPSGEGL